MKYLKDKNNVLKEIELGTWFETFYAVWQIWTASSIAQFSV